MDHSERCERLLSARTFRVAERSCSAPKSLTPDIAGSTLLTYMSALAESCLHLLTLLHRYAKVAEAGQVIADGLNNDRIKTPTAHRPRSKQRTGVVQGPGKWTAATVARRCRSESVKAAAAE